VALNAAAVFEIRAGGNDSNGGAFKTGASGTDYSQQDSPQVTIDGSTITAAVHTTTTQLTLTGYSVAAADVGNHVNVTGGTATAGLYEITAADTVNNRWTLDRSAGTAAQTATGRMGGALATPGRASQFATVAGQSIYLKYSATAYDCSASSNVAGGRVSLAASVSLIGYDTTRTRYNTDANRPIMRASANSMSITDMGGTNTLLRNIKFARAAAQTGVTGFTAGTTGALLERCQADTLATGFTTNTFSRFYECEAVACATGFSFGGSWTQMNGCVGRNCTSNAFNLGGSAFLSRCEAVGGPQGFVVNSNFCHFEYCVAYGQTGGTPRGWIANGFEFQAANCVATGGAGYGYDMGATPHVHALLINCAGYNNTLGNLAAGVQSTGFIALTADPFTSAAGLDFSLNGTAGGGAALKAAGYPSSFPGLVGTSYPDVGAYQHGDPAGAAVARVIGG
jgi:hypothetical protein